ncbi:putative ABC transporter ATP-binding protein YxlF [Robertmurraya siralis]|uniref:ABC transporter ATP-binding protein YxlF n=1 Tax=Robertmurraya siralis TaxID=77777 RepID=A0A920BUI2_9BACI|nr:ABC transporter ATP-binding protein [Robertmurraya siralis]GIN62347.1 putative ABC transporter ATP-binding protein YxlF [Robertmurraya siralis]
MLVNIQNLTKTYKQHQAVKGISFQIEKGKCVALLGPNGAGKTTTLQMLAGLLAPTSGKIQFANTASADFRQRIGFLPQHPTFFPWMTAKEFLQFAGKLSQLSKTMLEDKITETLEFVSLKDVRNKRIGGFSGGMKQRLGLAQALLHEPDLLILDEPVSALDPNGRRDVLEILSKLKREMTILFSTHVLHDAEQVCDSVMILKEGSIMWDGSLDSLKNSQASSAVQIKTAESLENVFEDLVMVEYIDASTVTLFPDPAFDTNLLLQRLMEKKRTLVHFERLQDSLEDAYMKVMNQ